MGTLDDQMLDTLRRYKQLAQNEGNQAALIKDSAVVQFLVYSLEGTSEAIKDTAMATLELLAINKSTHTTLRNTFGVMEALESIASSVEKGESDLPRRARHLHRCLEESKNLVWQVPKSVLISIPEMQSANCPRLWEALSSVPGVISCNFSVDQKLVTLTVFSSLNPNTLVQVIRSRAGMDADLYVPANHSFTKEKPDLDLPAYLSEEDSPIVQKKAVARRRPKRRESGWFTKAAVFVAESLLW